MVTSFGVVSGLTLSRKNDNLQRMNHSLIHRVTMCPRPLRHFLFAGLLLGFTWQPVAAQEADEERERLWEVCCRLAGVDDRVLL